MKRSFLALGSLSLLIACALVASGQQRTLSDADGYDWQGYDDVFKVAYCAGFINGSIKTVENFRLFLFCYNLRSREAEIEEEDLMPFYGITVGQLVGKLDLFYGDPRNTAIRVKDAVCVICREMKGADPEWVRREKEILRMPFDAQNVMRSRDAIMTGIMKGEYPGYEVREGRIYRRSTGREATLTTGEDVIRFYAQYDPRQHTSRSLSPELIRSNALIVPKRKGLSGRTPVYVIGVAALLLLFCAVFFALRMKSRA